MFTFMQLNVLLGLCCYYNFFFAGGAKQKKGKVQGHADSKMDQKHLLRSAEFFLFLATFYMPQLLRVGFEYVHMT
jgi:hypothetical protein